MPRLNGLVLAILFILAGCAGPPKSTGEPQAIQTPSIDAPTLAAGQGYGLEYALDESRVIIQEVGRYDNRVLVEIQRDENSEHVIIHEGSTEIRSYINSVGTLSSYAPFHIQMMEPLWLPIAAPSEPAILWGTKEIRKGTSVGLAVDIVERTHPSSDPTLLVANASIDLVDGTWVVELFDMEGVAFHLQDISAVTRDGPPVPAIEPLPVATAAWVEAHPPSAAWDDGRPTIAQVHAWAVNGSASVADQFTMDPETYLCMVTLQELSGEMDSSWPGYTWHLVYCSPNANQAVEAMVVWGGLINTGPHVSSHEPRQANVVSKDVFPEIGVWPDAFFDQTHELSKPDSGGQHLDRVWTSTWLTLRRTDLGEYAQYPVDVQASLVMRDGTEHRWNAINGLPHHVEGVLRA